MKGICCNKIVLNLNEMSVLLWHVTLSKRGMRMKPLLKRQQITFMISWFSSAAGHM